VLITGGLGFIGSHLAERLVGLGAEVTIVDNLAANCGGNRHNIGTFANRVSVRIADIVESTLLPELIADRDYLFNLAGQTGHLASMEDPFTDFEVNSRAQLAILEACRRQNPNIRIVHASTRQIYGRPEYLPVDERHPLKPIDVNGINKLAGESYHMLYSRVHGLQATALRLTNTIGPRMRVRDARQTFLGVWIRCVLEGVPFEVWEGSQLRDFTYVTDAVDAFVRAATCDAAVGEIFNLGGDCAISLHDLAELLVKTHGGGEYLIRSFPRTSRAIDIGDYYASFDRARSILGWQPATPLDQALSETLGYYRCYLDRYL
jgi:UDP-glucose 4-epimerase